MNLITTDTYSNCLEPLRSGKVIAVTTDNVILAGLADQNAGEFEVVGNPFTEEPYGIGLKKDDTAFRNFINDVLEKSYEDGRGRRRGRTPPARCWRRRSRRPSTGTRPVHEMVAQPDVSPVGRATVAAAVDLDRKR